MSVTELPGTTRLDVSATVPVTELEPVCAMAKTAAASETKIVRQRLLYIVFPQRTFWRYNLTIYLGSILPCFDIVNHLFLSAMAGHPPGRSGVRGATVGFHCRGLLRRVRREVRRFGGGIADAGLTGLPEALFRRSPV